MGQRNSYTRNFDQKVENNTTEEFPLSQDRIVTVKYGDTLKFWCGPVTVQEVFAEFGFDLPSNRLFTPSEGILEIVRGNTPFEKRDSNGELHMPGNNMKPTVSNFRKCGCNVFAPTIVKTPGKNEYRCRYCGASVGE
jgi:hypothetical protein